MPQVTNASSYWESRILADEEQAHRIADHASEEMAKVYRAQYLRVVKRVEELRDKLDYGKPLTRTELWNYARWTKVEESLRGYVSESSRINTDIIHKALDQEFKRVIGDESKNFGGALGRGGVMKLSPEAQQRILAGTWSGEHYSSRIWKNTAALADRMKNEITEMLVDGKSMPDIRRRLMYEFNVSYNNADRLARTEVSYVHNQATLERYKASGATQLKVLIVEDGKTCDKCRALADQPYSIDKPPMVPVHPRCRCCYAPWTYTDRKEWAKKHPEEGESENVAQKYLNELADSLQDELKSDIISDKDGHTYRRILDSKGEEKFRYLQTDAIQKLDSPAAVAKFFEYTDEHGNVMSPIDPSFSALNLTVQKELAEGILWTMLTLGLTRLPTKIKAEKLPKGIGEFSPSSRNVTFRSSIKAEEAFTTAIHEVSHFADCTSGKNGEWLCAGIETEALRELHIRKNARIVKQLENEIIGYRQVTKRDYEKEIVAYSMERVASGNGNELAQKIVEIFIRRINGK